MLLEFLSFAKTVISMFVLDSSRFPIGDKRGGTMTLSWPILEVS
jgi:hypothetical protein